MFFNVCGKTASHVWTPDRCAQGLSQQLIKHCASSNKEVLICDCCGVTVCMCEGVSLAKRGETVCVRLQVKVQCN